ncbi:MAG: pyridoxamine 5'-phosphate oxidase family protein [Acidimicrobiales bacterium]
MARWQELVAADPDFAGHVRRCFDIRKHATLATLRKDGSPRISGTEVEFDDDGEIYLGMMARSRKALDLRRDPRLALHCPTEDAPEGDPSSWLGDAKIAGLGVEVSEPEGDDGAHRFRIDVTEVVLTTVEGDSLVIRSWHPGRGVERRERR